MGPANQHAQRQCHHPTPQMRRGKRASIRKTPPHQHFSISGSNVISCINGCLTTVYVLLFHFRVLAFWSFFGTLRIGVACCILGPRPTCAKHLQIKFVPQQKLSSSTFKDNGWIKPKSCRKIRVRANSPNKASYSCPVATICYTLKVFDVCFSLVATWICISVSHWFSWNPLSWISPVFWFCDASKYIQYLPLFIATSRPVLSSLVHWTPPWNDLEVEQSAPQWLHQSIGRLSHDPL